MLQGKFFLHILTYGYSAMTCELAKQSLKLSQWFENCHVVELFSVTLHAFFYSAGVFIKKARERDPNFTYKTYLEKIEEISELLEKDAQKHDLTSGGYPYSSTVSAVACAARELALSDKWLKNVGQPHIY